MRAPDHLAGKRARCRCGAIVAIPEAEAEPIPAELDLKADSPLDLPLLTTDGSKRSSSGPTETPVCPNCLTDLAPGTVLCTSCGFHLQSGRLLSVSTGEERTPPTGSVPSGKSAASRKASTGGAGLAVAGILMTILKWAVVVGVVVGLAYAVRQGLSFDPRQQAVDAKNKVYPGTTVQQVVDAIGRPPTDVRVIVFESNPNSPIALPKEKRIGYQNDFMNTVDPKLIADGFFLIYRFTDRDILAISFDSEGKAEGAVIVDPMKPLGL
jgi:hypothetical protein